LTLMYWATGNGCSWYRARLLANWHAVTRRLSVSMCFGTSCAHVTSQTMWPEEPFAKRADNRSYVAATRRAI